VLSETLLWSKNVRKYDHTETNKTDCKLFEISNVYTLLSQLGFNKVAQTGGNHFLVFVRNVPTKGTARHQKDDSQKSIIYTERR
jgi:hypothetical protein